MLQLNSNDVLTRNSRDILATSKTSIEPSLNDLAKLSQYHKALSIVCDLPLELVMIIYSKAFTLHPEMEMHKMISMTGLDSFTDYMIGWWFQNGYSISLDQHNVHLFMLDHRHYDLSYDSNYIRELFNFLQLKHIQLKRLQLHRVLPKHHSTYLFDLVDSNCFDSWLFKSNNSDTFTNNAHPLNEKVFVLKSKYGEMLDCFKIPDKLGSLTLREKSYLFNISFEFYDLSSLKNWKNNQVKVEMNTYRSRFGNFTSSIKFNFTHFEFTNLKSISVQAHASTTIKLIDVPSTLTKFNVPSNTKIQVPKITENMEDCGLLESGHSITTF